GEGQQFASTDLSDQAGAVKVDAFVGDSIAVEEEHRDDRHPERLAGWRHAVELTEIGSQQVEFGDHRVVGDVETHIVVPLVGERRPSGPVVPHHLVVAVENLAGGHDLVVRVTVEGGQGAIELLGHLGVHVLFDERQAPLPEFVAEHVYSSGTLATASTSRRWSSSSSDSLSPISPRSITVCRIVLRSLSACLATAAASS